MAKRYPMPIGRHDEVMARDNYTCQAASYGLRTIRCFGALIVHHKMMKGAGGSADPKINDADNLVVLCGGVTGRDAHHGLVHDNPEQSYALGLLLRRGAVSLWKY
jgi:hypothetical protein